MVRERASERVSEPVCVKDSLSHTHNNHDDNDIDDDNDTATMVHCDIGGNLAGQRCAASAHGHGVEYMARVRGLCGVPLALRDGEQLYQCCYRHRVRLLCRLASPRLSLCLTHSTT